MIEALSRPQATSLRRRVARFLRLRRGTALSLIPPVGSNAATEVGPSPAACFDIAGVSAVGEEGEVRIYIAVAVMA